MTPPERETLDYAIVGGGVAGIYSAWRLLTDAPAGPRPKVALFEMSNRLGGRLLSVVPPLIPDARVELGGMRYIQSIQPWVTSLVEHLGLATESLPAGQPQNIAYLRGKMLRQMELTSADKIPYNLEGNERDAAFLDNVTAVAAMRALKATIKELLGKTIAKWEDLTTLTDDEWRTVAERGTWEGVPLHTLPMRYLMLRSISLEALDYAQDTSGYDSILYTWNGADGFSWNVGDYGPTVQYLHITDGYESLPRTLADRLVRAGGVIHLETRLTRFDATKDGVTLTLTDGKQSRTVHARRLILAMPRRSLELLHQSGSVLDPANADVHALIGSAIPIPLFKLGICYDRPWWQDLPPFDPGKGGPQRITNGKSVTDLPIRQCYYWKVNRKNNHAVILIYDDGLDLDYWAGLRELREGVERYPHDPAILSALASAPDWDKFGAPNRMVLEVHRQLLELHGNPPNVPLPYSAAYRDWGDDPFGGGANFWPVGIQSYKVSKDIVQPKPPLPVYICGDCYSHAQGWVEGALATAEEMLQDHLGVPRPAWKNDA
jgi:monoamine oxidase